VDRTGSSVASGSLVGRPGSSAGGRVFGGATPYLHELKHEPDSLPPPLYFSTGSSFALDKDALLCVRGKQLLDNLLHTDLAADGWQYVVEGSATNPKPGLVATMPKRTLRICWKPPARAAASSLAVTAGRRLEVPVQALAVPTGAARRLGAVARQRREARSNRYAFKLGYLKSYGQNVGAARISCSGLW
jgi:hypothetical protein